MIISPMQIESTPNLTSISDPSSTTDTSSSTKDSVCNRLQTCLNTALSFLCVFSKTQPLNRRISTDNLLSQSSHSINAVGKKNIQPGSPVSGGYRPSVPSLLRHC